MNSEPEQRKQAWLIDRILALLGEHVVLSRHDLACKIWGYREVPYKMNAKAMRKVVAWDGWDADITRALKTLQLKGMVRKYATGGTYALTTQMLWQENKPDFSTERATEMFTNWEAFLAANYSWSDQISTVLAWSWDQGQYETEYISIRIAKWDRVWTARVYVTREEEPVVRTWLSDRWDYMKKQWEPISRCDLSDVE